MRKKLRAVCITTAFIILVPIPPTGAQQTGHMPRIGLLGPGAPQTTASCAPGFSEGLQEHGWAEGQNIAIEYRWALGHLERLPELAAELVRLPVEVIFAVNTPAVLAVKQTGTQLPVVFAAVSEPIEIGAVRSLARPGGTFTGLTTMNRELMPKRLELLTEAMPGLTRVGYLANPTYAGHHPQLHEMQAAARSLGLELHPFEVHEGAELERAFAGMAAAHVGAFIVQQDALFGGICRKLSKTGKLKFASHCFLDTRFSHLASEMQLCDRTPHRPRRTRLIAPTTNMCDTAFLTPGQIRIGGPSQARPPVGLQ